MAEYSERYQKYFEKLFKNEGAFQKDPDDRGNYYKGKLYGTIYGITARDHFSVFIRVYELYKNGYFKEAKKAAMDFYYVNYYWPSLDYVADSSLAFKVFDFGVNAGPETAVKYLQQVIQRYLPQQKITHRLDLQTLTNINNLYYFKHKHDAKLIPGEGVLYALYIERLEKHYKSLWNFFKFGSGWLNRLYHVFNGAPDLHVPFEAESKPLEVIK